MPDFVTRTDREGVATLTLQRPEALNALSPALFQQLRRLIDDLAACLDSVAVVVLRGAGRSFSAGNDLTAIQAGERAPTPTFQSDTIEALAALAQPTIAAVHGHCYTGALELALACDFIVAAESAKFADTHGKWGMTPTWGMSKRLPDRIGAARAKEMMFTGRIVSGAEAAAIGLAVRCVADDQFDDSVQSTASAIATNSWFTSRTEKGLIDTSMHLSLADGLAHERATSPGAGPDMLDRLARR
jgi:enoyl-CoA hydratase